MLLGAVAAYYKYGDRTDIMEKSLKGTKEALDTLLAYLGTELSDSLSPILMRAVESEPSAEAVNRTLKSESFLDAVSDFINGEINEILQYRILSHARSRWAKWARRMRWGVFVLLVQEAIWTFFFAIWVKMMQMPAGQKTVVFAFSLSGINFVFAVVCAGAMLYYHDQITDCREKVL